MATPTLRSRSDSIVVRPLRDTDSARFDQILDTLHYLGRPPRIGRRLRYVAHPSNAPEQWLALLAWSEGALRYVARDHWIGWTPLQRRHRRHLVLLNTRFLVLPDAPVPHLGSLVLARAVRRLREDWVDAYGISPLLAETFVDGERFTGAVYRAAGWLPIGETAGYARTRACRRFHGCRKLAFVQPLVADARELLRGAQVPGIAGAPILLSERDLADLGAIIAHLPDPRRRQGRLIRSLHGLWTAMAAVALAGGDPVSDLESWLAAIPWTQWMGFGCRGSLRTAQPIVPSSATRRRALAAFRAAGGPDAVARWMRERALPPAPRRAA